MSNTSCDVVIVGTGAAGLFCALSLPESMNVHVITKADAEASDSFLAQGGICVLRGEEDFAGFFEDTMRAGHYENNTRSVELMIRSSNSVIRQLIRYGVEFEGESGGGFAFTREGAHSQPRILFHEDVTGKEITGALLRQARNRKNITILEYTTMVDIVEQDGVCGGIVAVDAAGTPFVIKAPTVVLACGGIGGLYQNSTNYPHITGDALAIALRHDIAVEHLDYVQIHPTTLFSRKKGRRFLISESVRGEGALLYDIHGNRFTDELQPRDKLSQAIFHQMQCDHSEYVWEDMRPIGRETILRHFPNIYRHCLEEGYDVLTQPIPVVPAQHYFMGGIHVNMASRTSMLGLYAVGETSCNGVHGRNRLASNSLLESLVFAMRAADDIVFGAVHPGCDVGCVNLQDYQDPDGILDTYRALVLREMDKAIQTTKCMSDKIQSA